MPANHGGRYIIRDGKRERVTGQQPAPAPAPSKASGQKVAKQDESKEKRNG